MWQMSRRRLLLVLAALGLLLAVAYLGISLFVAVRLTAPATSQPQPAPESAGLEASEVGFEADDGTDLEAWWVDEDGNSDRAVVLVDPASVPFLAGSEVDFVDDLMGASFRINNPNATASCGCGTSFSV